MVNSLKILYFAFTSLSTVGFGDIHPKSDIERLLVAAILLIGVAVFSYIMGTFISILDQHTNLNADFDDGDTLSKFSDFFATITTILQSKLISRRKLKNSSIANGPKIKIKPSTSRQISNFTTFYPKRFKPKSTQTSISPTFCILSENSSLFSIVRAINTVGTTRLTETS